MTQKTKYFFKSCYLLWTILLCFNFYAHISFTVLNKLCLIPLSYFLHCFKPDLLLQTTFPLPTLRAACGVVDVCVLFFFHRVVNSWLQSVCFSSGRLECSNVRSETKTYFSDNNKKFPLKLERSIFTVFLHWIAKQYCKTAK